MSVAGGAEVSGNAADSDTSFLGHPRGLAYIVFTEAWERFSFYGMQALLVLYMSSYLLQPGTVDGVLGFSGLRAIVEGVFGPLSVQALSTQLFGLYIGLVYFIPVFGGLLGDRYLGRTRAVLIGAALMAAGHFLMAFEQYFLFALAALIMGSGLLKGNLAAQVGSLYAKSDQRRDSAFSIYCVAINVGAFVSPLVCGTLGELYGWHYGFGVAGLGMLVGIAIYIKGRKYLVPHEEVETSTITTKMVPGDWTVVLALLGLLLITALYWTAQSQVWNTYPLWIKGRVDRELFELLVPVTWFQALDSLAVLVFAPLVLVFWRFQSKRQAEPSDLNKIALGCVFFAGACIWLAAGEIASGGQQVNLLWPVVFHFICALGYLYIGPVALSVVSRAAPPSVNAMMVGSYYLAIFVGGIFSGWLGRFYEVLSPTEFWLMHAAVVGSGAAMILLLRKILLKALRLSPLEQA